jgi:hypothetical protein
MGDDKISEEFNKDWIVSINLNFKILNQFLKHVFKDSKFDIIIHSKNFNRNCFVNWQDLLNGWAIVSYKNSSCFLELTLR